MTHEEICLMSESCSTKEPKHSVCGHSGRFCMACEAWCICPDLQTYRDLGYAAALRDAVEAVNGLPVVLYNENLGAGGDWNPCYRYGVRLTAAVAAIEALGGEQ